MAECIYCRARIPDQRFSRPDHVIPKAFGRFEGNLTVFCVCEDCNQWFGDNLELSFARNSAEAVMRLVFGLKASDEESQIRSSDRLEIFAGDGAMFPGAKTLLTQPVGENTLIASFCFPSSCDFYLPQSRPERSEIIELGLEGGSLPDS